MIKKSSKKLCTVLKNKETAEDRKLIMNRIVKLVWSVRGKGGSFFIVHSKLK